MNALYLEGRVCRARQNTDGLGRGSCERPLPTLSHHWEMSAPETGAIRCNLTISSRPAAFEPMQRWVFERPKTSIYEKEA